VIGTSLGGRKKQLTLHPCVDKQVLNIPIRKGHVQKGYPPGYITFERVIPQVLHTLCTLTPQKKDADRSETPKYRQGEQSVQCDELGSVALVEEQRTGVPPIRET
jgi:hypothetical protein